MANYLAEGFQTGFGIGAAAREKKKDREERDRLEAARRQFEKERQLDQIAAQKKLQDDRLVHDAQRQFSDQGWRSGESEKDRGWRTSERKDTQGFSAGESQLDRYAAALRQQKQLDEAARQFDAKMPLEGFQLGLLGRKQTWEESPENPLNKYRAANAESASMNDFTINGGAPSPLNGGAPVPIASKEEYDRLRPGTRFIWNGRSGTKP